MFSSTLLRLTVVLCASLSLAFALSVTSNTDVRELLGVMGSRPECDSVARSSEHTVVGKSCAPRAAACKYPDEVCVSFYRNFISDSAPSYKCVAVPAACKNAVIATKKGSGSSSGGGGGGSTATKTTRRTGTTGRTSATTTVAPVSGKEACALPARHGRVITRGRNRQAECAGASYYYSFESRYKLCFRFKFSNCDGLGNANKWEKESDCQQTCGAKQRRG